MQGNKNAVPGAVDTDGGKTDRGQQIQQRGGAFIVSRGCISNAPQQGQQGQYFSGTGCSGCSGTNSGAGRCWGCLGWLLAAAIAGACFGVSVNGARLLYPVYAYITAS